MKFCNVKINAVGVLFNDINKMIDYDRREPSGLIWTAWSKEKASTIEEGIKSSRERVIDTWPLKKEKNHQWHSEKSVNQNESQKEFTG